MTTSNSRRYYRPRIRFMTQCTFKASSTTLQHRSWYYSSVNPPTALLGECPPITTSSTSSNTTNIIIPRVAALSSTTIPLWYHLGQPTQCASTLKAVAGVTTNTRVCRSALGWGNRWNSGTRGPLRAKCGRSFTLTSARRIGTGDRKSIIMISWICQTWFLEQEIMDVSVLEDLEAV